MTAISAPTTPVVYAELAKAVTRLAGTVVKDPYQLAVLRFIADRTFGFQKLSEMIPVRHFIEGVQSKKSGVICAGVGMKEAKLYAVLGASREAGLVLTTKVGRRVRYAINLRWVISLAPPSKRDVIAAALTFEDREWGAAEARENLHAVEVLTPGNLHEVELNNKEHCPLRAREETNGEAVASRYAGPDFLIGKEQEKTAPNLPLAKVQENAPSAKRKRKAAEPHPVALFDAFENKARAMWPDMTVFHPMTGKQLWKLRALSRSWSHPEATFGEFLEWCAANWRGVWASKFAHVKTDDPAFQVTDYPDIGTLIYFHRAFTDAFIRRESQRIRAGLTREDNLVRRLMLKGFSHEDALKDAAEIMAKDRVREDLEVREAELNTKVRRLEAKEQDIDTRIALGRAATLVKPVSLTKHSLKPTFAHGGDVVAPLPPFPEWRDELEEVTSQASGLPTTHAVAT